MCGMQTRQHMHTSTFAPILLLILGLSLSTVSVAQSDGRLWLDNALEVSTKSKATHYMQVGEKTPEGYKVAMYDIDGILKMEGISADSKTMILDGEVTFYHPNGNKESKGHYMDGQKIGVWERWSQAGKPMAERSYAAFNSEAMAYTYVDEMPVFEGGEKKFEEILKHRLGTCVSEFAEQQKEVYISFIISEKGNITQAKVSDGRAEIASERLIAALTGLPDWTPGKKQGRPARVLITMPIKLESLTHSK